MRVFLLHVGLYEGHIRSVTGLTLRILAIPSPTETSFVFTRLAYMASHLRNLEAVLQTYRQINLTTQSVFLVMGTFLLTRIIETDIESALFLELLLVGLTVFSNIVMWRFQKVILARGEDVNWWLRHMLKAEQALSPDERMLTRFKIYQSEKRISPDHTARLWEPGDSVTDGEIDRLLDAEVDQIRKVINNSILRGMRLMWVLVLGISAGSIMLKL